MTRGRANTCSVRAPIDYLAMIAIAIARVFYQLVANVNPSNTLISDADGLINDPLFAPPTVQLEVLISLVVPKSTEPEASRVAKLNVCVHVSDGSPIIPLHFTSNPMPAATDVSSSVVDSSFDE